MLNYTVIIECYKFDFITYYSSNITNTTDTTQESNENTSFKTTKTLMISSNMGLAVEIDKKLIRR